MLFSTIRIGHTGMPIQHIVENVVAVAKRLSQKLPGGTVYLTVSPVSPSYKEAKPAWVTLLFSVSEVEREALVREGLRRRGRFCLSSLPLSAVRVKPRDSAHETC